MLSESNRSLYKHFNPIHHQHHNPSSGTTTLGGFWPLVQLPSTQSYLSAFILQRLTPIISKSLMTPSSHLFSGLPFRLLLKTFSWNFYFHPFSLCVSPSQPLGFYKFNNIQSLDQLIKFFIIAYPSFIIFIYRPIYSS